MRNSYRRNKLYPKKRGGMNMDQNMDQNMGQNTRVVNAAMEGDMPMPTKANNNDMPMPTKANNNDMPMANNNCPPCPRLDENKKEEGGIMASITGFNDKLATGPPAFLAGLQGNLSNKFNEQKGKFDQITSILKGGPEPAAAPVAAPAAAPIEGGRRRRRTKKNKKSKKGKKGGKGKKSKKSRKGKKSKKRTIRR